MKRNIKHLHAHFAWTATDAARVISELTGVPYSLTAHQSDINRYADDNLDEKLRNAKFIVTCTKGNREYLGSKYGNEIYRKSVPIYHGVDIEKFEPSPQNESTSIDILSIGNVVAIKGFEYLVRACATLKSRGISHRCVIIGKGSQKESLLRLISDLDLGKSVEIRDPVDHDKIAEYYHHSKIFVLPVVVIDGAPHGIPNVLAEAMATGLAVVSTNVPDIPELIENGKDGVLVSEKDTGALACSIEDLLKNDARRSALGAMARKKIQEEFDARKHFQKIAQLFLDCGNSQ